METLGLEPLLEEVHCCDYGLGFHSRLLLLVFSDCVVSLVCVLLASYSSFLPLCFLAHYGHLGV